MSTHAEHVRAELARAHGYDVLGDWPPREAREIVADVLDTVTRYGATIADAFTFALLAPGESWPDGSPAPAWWRAWRLACVS